MPKKLFYRMGEACEITGLEPHVLRFWESEFSQLKPRKNRAGHRVFNEADIEIIQQIKRLLHEEGFTIAGAQKKMSGEDEDREPSADFDKKTVLRELAEVKSILQNLLKLLDRP